MAVAVRQENKLLSSLKEALARRKNVLVPDVENSKLILQGGLAGLDLNLGIESSIPGEFLQIEDRLPEKMIPVGATFCIPAAVFSGDGGKLAAFWQAATDQFKLFPVSLSFGFEDEWVDDLITVHSPDDLALFGLEDVAVCIGDFRSALISADQSGVVVLGELFDRETLRAIWREASGR